MLAWIQKPKHNIFGVFWLLILYCPKEVTEKKNLYWWDGFSRRWPVSSECIGRAPFINTDNSCPSTWATKSNYRKYKLGANFTCSTILKQNCPSDWKLTFSHPTEIEKKSLFFMVKILWFWCRRICLIMARFMDLS